MYISDWTVYVNGVSDLLKKAVGSGKIAKTDIVWRGPAGDAVVTGDPASLDEAYADYTDEGQVSEYLD